MIDVNGRPIGPTPIEVRIEAVRMAIQYDRNAHTDMDRILRNAKEIEDYINEKYVVGPEES